MQQTFFFKKRKEIMSKNKRKIVHMLLEEKTNHCGKDVRTV